jgi:DNA-binding MarR family transcriptional regulator
MSRSSTRSDLSKRPRDKVDAHVDQAIREFPEIDPSVEAIVSRIDKLSRYLNKSQSESLARHELTDGEYKVLVKLRLAGDPFRLSPGELSQMLLLSTGAMTNRLDRLEERDLVVRKPDPRDRRGIFVELTSRGREVLAAAVREQAAKEATLVEVLDGAEREKTNELLRKLLIHFEALMGPPPKHREQPE